MRNFVHLLKISSKAMHILIVWQQAVSLRLEEINVPDSQQGEQNGRVLIHGSRTEVRVLKRHGDC